MNKLIKSVLVVMRRNILRSSTAIHWKAGCWHSTAYLACQAAEIPVKSAQEFVQAHVVPVDTPKLNSSPAEGFLLSCILEREMLQIATGQLDFEHWRERFPFDFFSDPSVVQECVNFPIFVNFLGFLLLLVFSFIPLWLEKILDMILDFLNKLGFFTL